MATYPSFETKRFVLRPLATGDAEAVFSFFSDPVTAAFTGREPYTKLEQGEKKVANDLQFIAEGSAFAWAITHRGDAGDRAIGVVSLFHFSRPNRDVEIGYVLSRAEWSAGVMTECMPPVLRFAFESLEVHRVDAHIDARNTASIRLVERCGFVREGALREKSRDVTGAFGDLVMYGLLDREWKATQ